MHPGVTCLMVVLQEVYVLGGTCQGSRCLRDLCPVTMEIQHIFVQ